MARPTEFDPTEELSRVLYDKMEHLDPSNEHRGWEMLTDAERQFYRSCVGRLALETKLLEALIRGSCPPRPRTSG